MALSVVFEVLGAGGAGAGVALGCVLPAAGGCDPLDLLPDDFVVLAAFELEFTVCVFAAAECVVVIAATGCALEFPAVVATLFADDMAGLGEAAGCAAAVAAAAFSAGGGSAEAVNTISTGAFASAGADLLATATGEGAAGATAGADAALLFAGFLLTETVLTAGALGGAGAGMTLAATGADAGPGFAAALTGTSDAGAAGCAAALAAAARLAALAAGLLLSSSSGGKPGNVLSGT